MNKLKTHKTSRLVFLTGSVVLASQAAAQAPPDFWVRFSDGFARSEARNNFGRSVSQTPVTPSGLNLWNGQSEAYKVGTLFNRPTGGYATSALFLSQSASYPQLMVTERTNVRTWCVDNLSIVNNGYATSRTNCTFECEEFSYLQLSRHHFGYVDTIGQNTFGSSWSREVSLNGSLIWKHSSTEMSDQFRFWFLGGKFLLSPGVNQLTSEQNINSFSSVLTGLEAAGRCWHMHESHQNVGNFNLPSSSWWVYPVPNDTAHPDAFQVMNGGPVGGSLRSLQASDNDRLTIRGGGGTRPEAFLYATVTLPNLPDLALRAYVESSCVASGVTQTISLFNFQTNRYEAIDTRVTPRQDGFALARVQDVSKYVHPTLRVVGLEMKWMPPTTGNRFWDLSVDEIRVMAFRR